MNDIHGLDMSHWQGTNIDWIKMVQSGIQFVYLKASQGTSYRDDCFETNAANAKKVGILVGAYHFCTTENATSQYNCFMSGIGTVKLDLPPALDIEQYTDRGTTKIISGATADIFLNMLHRYQGFPLPAVYTNQSFGNKVFPYPQYSRVAKYPLWIANWKADRPNFPKVWEMANQPYYIWQSDVVDGGPYGVPGDVDYDLWGTKMEFPSKVVVPPVITSPTVVADISVKIGNDVYHASNVTLTKK